MKRASLLILLNYQVLVVLGQFNHPFNVSEYSTSCCQIKKEYRPASKVHFTYVDTCSNTSGFFNLIVLDSTKYFRNGRNVWNYDMDFQKPKAIIPFYLGVPYGFLQTYYPNGNIQSEGVCKTIRYFQPSGSKIIFKIDRSDTTLLRYNGRSTYDSILAISKNSFINPITFETSYTEEPGNLIIYFPFYQKQKIGLWKYYDENGTLTKLERYVMGKLIEQ